MLLWTELPVTLAVVGKKEVRSCDGNRASEDPLPNGGYCFNIPVRHQTDEGSIFIESRDQPEDYTICQNEVRTGWSRQNGTS